MHHKLIKNWDEFQGFYFLSKSSLSLWGRLKYFKCLDKSTLFISPMFSFNILNTMLFNKRENGLEMLPGLYLKFQLHIQLYESPIIPLYYFKVKFSLFKCSNRIEGITHPLWEKWKAKRLIKTIVVSLFHILFLFFLIKELSFTF